MFFKLLCPLLMLTLGHLNSSLKGVPVAKGMGLHYKVLWLEASLMRSTWATSLSCEHSFSFSELAAMALSLVGMVFCSCSTWNSK